MIRCERHPPERRRDGGQVVSCGCCCCCCCLHSLGSLICAGVVTKKAPVWGKAWWSLVALSFLLCWAANGVDRGGEAAFVVLLVLPGVMMAASLLLGVLMLFDDCERRAGLAEVTWLGVWSFAGGAIGMVLMLGLAFVLG